MFRFRLQSLLQHRKHHEDDCQKDLARARTALQKEEQALNRFQERIADQQRKMQAKQKDRHTVTEIKNFQNFLLALEQDIARQQQRVVESQAQFEEKRSNLMEAMKQRKILERLKENERLRYHRNQQKKERSQMDEVASGQHIRKDPT